MRFSGREHRNAYFMFGNFFRNLCLSWDNVENILEPGSPQMIIFRMRIACWTRQATNTLSEYSILASFPLQHWLHERTSVLRYLYVDCR